MNSRYDLADVKAAALGRWPEIHAALGVPPEYLNTRKHQPCPYCGGKDRYRYTDFQQGGGFICNQCTPDGGSGFDLLMLVFGYDFKRAAHEVAALLGFAAPASMPSDTPRRPAPPFTPKPTPTDQQPALLKIWHEARPIAGNNPASLYLHGRGLPAGVCDTSLRYEPALPLYALRANDDHTAAPLLIGYFPAMIAAVCNARGEMQGLHITYLQTNDNGQTWQKLQQIHPETGLPLPAKKMRARFPDSLRGAGVYLGKADNKGRLIVAEGIETALAARLMFGLPAIATLSANGMRRFQWRPNVKALFIVADNDLNQVGQAAANELARRAVSDGIQAAIWQSETAGFDALDEYNRRQGKPS